MSNPPSPNGLAPPRNDTDATVTISRLGLAPFRSAAALRNPRRAALRIVRILVAAAGCSFAHCEIVHDALTQEQRGPAGSDARRCTIGIEGPEGRLGRLEVVATAERVARLRPDLIFMAQTLGALYVVHRRIGESDGHFLSAAATHTLANQVNALSMQLAVVQALHKRSGSGADLGGFIATAQTRCLALQDFVAALRRS